MTLKQTQGVRPVERQGDHVNESSHLPPSSDSAVLSSLLAHAPLSVIAYDGMGRIVMWNAEAERVLGWPAADVLGKPAPFPVAVLLPGEARREIGRASCRERVLRLV